ncbi:MAG: ADP-ribosylglycohydrolase family protein [Chloroflexi bacterium]|nr:ADP-ribosylglycohydrolase family protein [Chloroflexota bacterium]
MHDVLDPRDLVPDEAEQLAQTGYPVGTLLSQAREAAADADLTRLDAISAELAALERDSTWPYDEPTDEDSLRATAGAVEMIAVDHSMLPARVRGAWLGRAVGNTLGKPVEGLSRKEVETYLRAAGQWPITDFLPLLEPLPDGVTRLHPSAGVATSGRFEDVPRDDDLDWTILGLHLLERHGRELTTSQIAAGWLDRIPFTQTYTAERAAYRNLIRGLRPPETAAFANPYREWIGALIRGDIFGYINPGDPGGAARLALVDARLSHVANGIYGEMWAAALVSAAFATDTAEQALGVALQVVPGSSRLAEALREVQRLFETGASAVQALDWIDDALGDYSWVHTLNNAALIAVALLWGERFMDAASIAIMGGRDTDSTTATVGSVFGALHGDVAIPTRLVGSTHVHVRSAVRDFDRVTIDELAHRTLMLIPVAE